MADDFLAPLKPDRARILIREIMATGRFMYSGHAMEEMAADGLTTVDCQNTLRSGVVRAPDLEKGSWRYRVETSQVAVVIAFRSSDRFVVVTAWRKIQ